MSCAHILLALMSRSQTKIQMESKPQDNMITQQRLSGYCWDEVWFIYLFIFVSHHKKSVISALLRKEEGKYHVDRGTELILFGCLVAKHNVFLITNQWNLCDEWLAQVWSPPSPDRCPTSLIHPSDICCSPATSLSSSELLHWRQTIMLSILPFVADCFFNFGSKKRLRPGSQVGRTIPPALTNTYMLTLLSMFKPFSCCADW